MPAPVLTDEVLTSLNRRVRCFGCPELIPLRRPTSVPAQIHYLDLLPSPQLPADALLPQAVAEFQQRALIYFVDGDRQKYPAESILELQQRLANRGDHAVLAVVRPGDLTLYPLNLDRAELLRAEPETVSATAAEAPFLFQNLATALKAIPGGMTKADPVFEEIHRLMSNASRALAGQNGEGPLDGMTVLSTTGRALFFRFLIDRSIVRPEDLPKICPQIRNGDLRSVFNDARCAAATSAWLDETFNGDLLPLVESITKTTPAMERERLYRKAYEQAGEDSGGALFSHLEAILKGYDALPGGAVQLAFPGAVDWDDLNFRHIPVGVLSQVYESFSHDWDADAARTDSVHYTPKNMAKLLVEHALEGLDEPHKARVLDPACGAGVFLVLAFRDLVRRRWQHDGRRPGTKVIHNILYQQLCGFDISEPALRLTALGLYITAIELNEIIRPPEALHVPEALEGLVLFNHGPKRSADRKKGFVIGSLGDEVSKDFNGAFDAVVGNPPWTRLKVEGKDEAAKDAIRQHNATIDEQFNKIGVRVLRASGLEQEANDYDSPGGVPDIPFIWRAKEWTRPGGAIALALEGGLILEQSGPSKMARDCIFKALTVTGILNGSRLAKTRVWSGHDMPWILFWALNQSPTNTDYDFHFLTPVREEPLSSRSMFRLDFQSAFTISARSIIERGWLFKALSMGTILDLDVQDKLEQAIKNQTVETAWKVSNKGFSLNPRKPDKKAPDWLLDLPVFKKPEETPIFDGLEGPVTFKDHFGVKMPHRPLVKEAYKHPLLLIAERPGVNRDQAKSYCILDRDTCFSVSYYGYSAAGMTDPELSVALLHLIVHSYLFRHFCFIRSPRVGAGRNTIYKEDVDNFPFPVVADLSNQERKLAIDLANQVNDLNNVDWDAVDRFVCKLFQIPATDTEVIRDTVTYAAPYKEARDLAMSPPDKAMLDSFASKLETALQPLFKAVKQRVRVQIVPKTEEVPLAPWRFATVLLEGDSFEPTSSFVAAIMKVAAETAASRVVMAVPSGGLVLGLLNQRRFWTRSRARLCAMHIAREHLDKNFPLPGRA
jgi:hypothetical protein